MLATEKERFVIAKEIMSRMLKQEGFCDSTGLFFSRGSMAAFQGRNAMTEAIYT